MAVHRNNSNDIWRITFTFMIVFVHIGIGSGWYIGVDYFFILSGYLIGLGVDTKTYGEYSFKYLADRIKKLYPHLVFSFFIFFSWKCLIEKWHFKQMGEVLFEHLGEIIPMFYFLCSKDGLGSYPYNFQVWYISILLICSLIIHYLIVHYRDIFYNVIAPISVAIIFTFLARNRTSFNTGDTIGLLDDYILRGWAEMCMGSIIYHIVCIIEKREKTDLYYRLIHFVEYVCFFTVILFSYYRGSTKYDSYYVLILGMAVFCSFQYKKSFKLPSFIKYMSDLTYAIYLNHMLIIKSVYGMMESMRKDYRIMILLIVLIVYSMITDKLVKVIYNRLVYLWRTKFVLG